jgi:hypothetical protein
MDRRLLAGRRLPQPGRVAQQWRQATFTDDEADLENGGLAPAGFGRWLRGLKRLGEAADYL